MMCPPPLARMCGIAWRQSTIGARRSICQISSRRSSGISSTPPWKVMPALLTRISRRPNSAIVASTSAWVSSM